ncbi:hypothetical protein MP228_008941 [Amoeboaphelidium protococcarum]|nr:hypothetical protein MP228_008941 [Amoeboaphelidium protococcarum]
MSTNQQSTKALADFLRTTEPSSSSSTAIKRRSSQKNKPRGFFSKLFKSSQQGRKKKPGASRGNLTPPVYVTDDDSAQSSQVGVSQHGARQQQKGKSQQQAVLELQQQSRASPPPQRQDQKKRMTQSESNNQDVRRNKHHLQQINDDRPQKRVETAPADDPNRESAEPFNKYRFSRLGSNEKISTVFDMYDTSSDIQSDFSSMAVHRGTDGENGDVGDQQSDNNGHKKYRKSKFPEQLLNSEKTSVQQKKMSYILMDDDLMAVINRINDNNDSFKFPSELNESPKQMQPTQELSVQDDILGNAGDSLEQDAIVSDSVLKQLNLLQSHIVNGGAMKKAANTDKRKGNRVKFSGYDRVIPGEDYSKFDKQDSLSNEKVVDLQTPVKSVTEHRKTGIPDEFANEITAKFFDDDDDDVAVDVKPQSKVNELVQQNHRNSQAKKGTELDDDLHKQLEELRLFAERLPSPIAHQLESNGKVINAKKSPATALPKALQGGKSDLNKPISLNLDEFQLNWPTIQKNFANPMLSKDLPSPPSGSNAKQQLKDLRKSMTNTPPPAPISTSSARNSHQKRSSPLRNELKVDVGPQRGQPLNDTSQSSSSPPASKKKVKRRHIQIQARPVTFKSIGVQASFPAEGNRDMQ